MTMHILNRIEFKRGMQRKGFRTHQQLALALGLHRNTISHYLSGAPVLPEKLERLLVALELPIERALLRVDSETAQSDTPISDIVDRLHERHPRVAFVLFGSRARRTHGRYSDYDLGAYSKDGISHEEYRAMRVQISEAAEALPVDIDLVNLHRADPGFLARVLRDGRMLAGRRSDWNALQEQVGHG
jgi:predicted nucleotidyltransferase